MDFHLRDLKPSMTVVMKNVYWHLNTFKGALGEEKAFSVTPHPSQQLLKIYVFIKCRRKKQQLLSSGGYDVPSTHCCSSGAPDESGTSRELLPLISAEESQQRLQFYRQLTWGYSWAALNSQAEAASHVQCCLFHGSQKKLLAWLISLVYLETSTCWNFVYYTPCATVCKNRPSSMRTVQQAGCPTLHIPELRGLFGGSPCSVCSGQGDGNEEDWEPHAGPQLGRTYPVGIMQSLFSHPTPVESDWQKSMLLRHLRRSEHAREET